MTPGQQSAALALVTPADLKRAKAVAKELRIPDLGLSPMMLAMAVKARQLASAIGCDTKEAWLLLQRERADLMPYIHQRQAQAADDKAKALPTVFMIPDGAGDQAQLADFSMDDEAVEFVEDLAAPADQVGQTKSDDDA
jgi:hypothetical protein